MYFLLCSYFFISITKFASLFQNGRCCHVITQIKNKHSQIMKLYSNHTQASIELSGQRYFITIRIYKWTDVYIKFRHVDVVLEVLLSMFHLGPPVISNAIVQTRKN